MSADRAAHVLRTQPGELAVCRLGADEPVPGWAAPDAAPAPLLAVTRTAAELSVVCAAAAVPAGVRAERGWRALTVVGPLDFALTGVLAALAAPLAAAGVPIFAISTFDTDHLLVRERDLATAQGTLRAAGHRVEP